MSLLHQSIENKKFDVRLVEKNLVRNVITSKEYDQFINQLPDDSENANYISLDEIEDQ